MDDCLQISSLTDGPSPNIEKVSENFVDSFSRTEDTAPATGCALQNTNEDGLLTIFLYFQTETENTSGQY